jgi:group I intron endonuclease
MSNIYTIYKATNRETGKSYIGFDSNWPNRMISHKRDYKRRKTKFYSALKKYGWNSFYWETLYQSENKEICLNQMEQYYISKFNSIEEGYNMTEGGSGVLGIVKNTIWINNGKDQKRVKIETEIPNGWYRGRLKFSRNKAMTQESRLKISQKNKGKLAEGSNPSAKRIVYKGETFDCIKSAAIIHNTSVYFIKKNGQFV